MNGEDYFREKESQHNELFVRLRYSSGIKSYLHSYSSVLKPRSFLTWFLPAFICCPL